MIDDQWPDVDEAFCRYLEGLGEAGKGGAENEPPRLRRLGQVLPPLQEFNPRWAGEGLQLPYARAANEKRQKGESLTGAEKRLLEEYFDPLTARANSLGMSLEAFHLAESLVIRGVWAHWAKADGLAAPETRDPHRDAAAEALEKTDAKGDSQARAMLADEIAEHCRRFFAATIKEHNPQMGRNMELWLSRPDGRLWLDEQFCRYLEGLGEEGKKAAADKRGKSTKRCAGRVETAKDLMQVWRLWFQTRWDKEHPDVMLDPRVPALETLGVVLWEEGVRGRWEWGKKITAPSMPALAARGVLYSLRSTKISTAKGQPALFTDGDWKQRLPAATLIDVAQGALDERVPRAVAAVAAYLATEVHRRYMVGEDRFDYVWIPAGCNELRGLFGFEMTEAELDEALEWLGCFTLAGFPSVAGVSAESDRRPGGGRPAKGRMVQVGAPLAPQGLARVYEQQRLTLPAHLRWYSPVLLSTLAPLAGYRKTWQRQRDAFSLGLGVVLMELRDEYADRGVPLDSMRGQLRSMGLYERTHQSLVDDLLAAWVKPPQPPLPMDGFARGAVLVETAPGSGRYHLGPDHEKAHRMVVNAAGHAEEKNRRIRAQKARQKGRK